MRRFALSFSLDDTRQYLVVNDLQRIAITNINPEERVSDPFFLYTPTGGDEWWIPPWIDIADSTLLSWMFRRRMAVLTLRVTWSQSGTMSVWPDSETWVNSERWYYVRLDLGALREAEGVLTPGRIKACGYHLTAFDH